MNAYGLMNYFVNAVENAIHSNGKCEYGKVSEFIIELPIKQHKSGEFILCNSNDTHYNDKFIEKMNVEFSDIYK